MAAVGRYLDKHSRKYVNYNPNEFTGPFTWRLSMMPSVIDKPDQITSIFTILPIDSNTNPDGSFNLFFNIDSLEDVNAIARRASGAAAARGLLQSPYSGTRATTGITSITGIAPVQTDQKGTDVAIYFDIDSLRPLEKRKTFFSVKANDYNSRSIDKLSADKPLFTTGSDDVVVTFDISSLENA